jgi:murein DD-endopeptidase MepM/ murein hydrolase activator NlpD/pimeloyl-ACP methyl ester carboxylesterase
MVFDSLNAAKQVSFGNTLTSDVGAVSGFDRTDFYRFEVKNNSGAYLSLSGLSADASLMLMDTAGKSLAVSNQTGGSAESININLTAGTYYIGVSQISGNTTYKLNLSSNAAFANITDNVNWLSADFNGDNFEDVLRQEKGTWVDGVNDVQFFLGNADGGFQAAVNITNMYWMNGNGVNLIVGDLNGDGRTDLIRQEKGDWVDGIGDAQILTFQNGNFQTVGDMPSSGGLNGNYVNLIASDLNGDGRTDLIRQEKGTWVDGNSDVQVIMSKGGWEFMTPTAINNMGAMTGNNVTLVASGSDLMRLEMGDWVNGSNDVQFTSFVNDEFSVPVDNPTDSFSKAVVSKPWEASMARTYAVNQSILGQLVSSNATNISPYGTTGRYSAYSTGGSIHWSAKTGAIVITSEMEKVYGRIGGSSTWLGMPIANQYAWKDGTRQDFEGGYLFRNATQSNAFRPNELPVAMNDFTGDGKADLLWRNGATGGNLFWQMNGPIQSGSAWTDPVADKNFKIVGIADFDRDGQNDILWNHSVTGDNVIWRMNGMKHIGDLQVDKASNLNWQIAGVGDFDKDGRVDILWRDSVTGDNLVWKMDKNVHIGDLKIQAVPDSNWQVAGVADFTGDYQTDILWRNNATGDNLIWRMDGTALTDYLAVDKVTDLSWQVASVADLNQDGKTDIFWRNNVTGHDLLWQMDGNVRRVNSDIWLPQVSDMTWSVAGNGNIFIGDSAIARAEDANKGVIGSLKSNPSTLVSPLGTIGRVATYSSGANIYWTAKGGAVLVTSDMEAVYKPQGSSSGWLGLATTNQYNWSGGTRQDFEGGYLFKNSNQVNALRPNELPNVDASLLQATGAVIESAKLFQKVAQTYQSRLGKALTGLVDQGDGTQKQTFELGYLRTMLGGSYTTVQFVMTGDYLHPLTLSVAPIPPSNLAEIFQKNVRQYASILGNPLRPDIHDAGYRKQMLFANHILVWEGGDKLEIRQVNEMIPDWLKEVNKRIQLETAIDITPEYLRVASARSNIEDYWKGNASKLGVALGNLTKQPDGSYKQLYENAAVSYKDGKTTVTLVNTIPSPFILPELPSGGKQGNNNVLGGSIDSVWLNYQGTLGKATSDVYTFGNDVTYQLFERGSIVKSVRGTYPLYGAIRERYKEQGGLGGWLGVPTSAETGLGNGIIQQNFVNGYILWNGSVATAYSLSGGNPPADSSVNQPLINFNPTTQNPLKGFSHPLGGAGFITQGNGGTTSHNGRQEYAIDYGVPIGTSVYAMRSGRVVAIESRYPDTGGGEGNADRANYIVIEHDNGYRSAYLHLQQGFSNKAGLRVGDSVNAGQIIGHSGNSGWSTGPHLHVEVHKPGSGGYFGQTVPFQIDNSNNIVVPLPSPQPLPTPQPTKIEVVSIDREISRGGFFRLSGRSSTDNVKFYINGAELRASTLNRDSNGLFTVNLTLPNDIKLGKYQISARASGGEGTDASSYSDFTNVTLPSNYFTGSLGMANDGMLRNGSFSRIDGRKIENKKTWIVIHGFNTGPDGDIENLARAIDSRDNTDQVLTLDWSQASKTGLGLKGAATWITSVASLAAKTIIDWGISSFDINVAGHSLGAYVAYEISKQLGGIGNLVVLDPASTTLGGYQEWDVKFDSYSRWSWSFYSSLGGNFDKSQTTHEAFKIDFPWTNDIDKHGAGVKLWTNMLQNPNYGISNYFDLDRFNSSNKPWTVNIGSGWEKTIKAKDTDPGTGVKWMPDDFI